MITLSIPVDEEGMIAFNATLFAIVRASLKIDSSYNKNSSNINNSEFFNKYDIQTLVIIIIIIIILLLFC